MSDDQGLSKFPDIDEKLNAPKKVSAFEKQRLEAESKRLREEAETRKALRDFEDSFADDQDDELSMLASGGRPSAHNTPGGPRGSIVGGSGGSRHFLPPSGRKDVGPGSLGPAPPTLKRKRELEEIEERRRLERGSSGQRDGHRRLAEFEDDEDADRTRSRRSSPEAVVRKPTILLQSLPPTITKEDIRRLLPQSLKIEDVRFVEPTDRHAPRQRTLSAIVTASADTPISDIDKAVSDTQHQYLGSGCYLKISRHVSTSGSKTGSLGNILPTSDGVPFGAKQAVHKPLPVSSFRNAAPPPSLDRHPPPSQYTSNATGQIRGGPGLLQVTPTPPWDIKQLKLIHRTAEKLLKYGPQFESALMSNAEVQKGEKWAWLFDATSQGGVYYRWLVWKICCEDPEMWVEDSSRITPMPSDSHVFDSGPVWIRPNDLPRYENVTDLEALVDDEDYVSSDDESGDEGEKRQFNTGGAPAPVEDDNIEQQARYLNPYRKAKLTHLLARLPDSIAMLRVGDVSRVTNFVVNNAGKGAEEIVDMLLLNVERPFRLSVKYDDDEQDISHPSQNEHAASPTAEEEGDSEADAAKKDISNLKLIGLYLVSDALQASSTSGVRDAWKYRQLFETALTHRKTFEHLGRLEKELHWGRLKAEQWKRKVGVVLGLWEAMSTFPADIQMKFKTSFLEPPLTDDEKRSQAIEDAKKEQADATKSRWRNADEVREEESKTTKNVPSERPSGSSAGPDSFAARMKALREKASATETNIQSASPQNTSAVEKVTPASQATAPKPPSEQADKGRRSRPTAADLNEAPPVRPTDPAKTEQQPPAPPVRPGGFGFSMSIGAKASPPTAVPAEPQVEVKETHTRPPANDIFADSDDDM